MMRIQILSDLHLEFEGNSIPALAPDVDAIILAGDLAPVCTNRIREITERWRQAKPHPLRAGNHEYYGSEIREAQRELAHDCSRYGVTLLDPGAVTINGIRFIGATLWTDFLLEGDAASEVWAISKSATRSPTSWVPSVSAAATLRPAKLPTDMHGSEPSSNANLKWRNRRASPPWSSRTTHRARHVSGPGTRGNQLNPGFASDLDRLIARYQPMLWIHGHMHDRIDECSGKRA